jgi:hypothetical protein
VTQIEFIIQPDGSILVPRGNPAQNELTSSLLAEEVCDKDALSNFLAVSDDCELLFGDQFLCG